MPTAGAAVLSPNAGAEGQQTDPGEAPLEEATKEGVSLEERWEAARDAGLGALTPELTDAFLAEAQSKGLWELELEVRYWTGHRAFFFEGPEAAHLHWRFLTDLEPDDVNRPHVSRAHNSIGLLFMLQSDWVTARDHYCLSLKLATPSQRNEPRVNLANVEIELGELRSAVGHYARALEEATPPEAFACLAGLSNVCIDVGLLEAARALDRAAQVLLDDPEIDPVADIGPWSQYALDERACRLLLRAGAFRAAQHALEELRRDVAFEDLSWTGRQSFAEMLAELALETGRPDHALATLDENRMLNPEHDATPSEWMLRARALADLAEWEPAWQALERCDADQLSAQSQGFEDYWVLLGELARQTERQAQAALAERRIEQARQHGAQLTRSELRSTFTLPGLAPFVGHLAATPAVATDAPAELADGEASGVADVESEPPSNASDAAKTARARDSRLWLLGGAGLTALLLAAASGWTQRRRSRELDRLQAALDALEMVRQSGNEPHRRRDASQQVLQATLEVLDVEPRVSVVAPEWGGEEGDIERMLELASDCLRLQRASLDRADNLRVRSDVGRALLTSARRIEGEALERGLALKFALPKEPVVSHIPERDLSRLFERLLPLVLEAAQPESGLRFELQGGGEQSKLTIDLEQPGDHAEAFARGFSAARQTAGSAGVVFQDIRVLVLERVARARGAELSVEAADGRWRMVLTWPTPGRSPSS